MRPMPTYIYMTVTNSKAHCLLWSLHLELRVGGGGGAVLIYLPRRPFSLQSFLLFLPKIRGGATALYTTNVPINAKPTGGGEGERRGIGRDLIDRFGPAVGHLNYLAGPGVGIFEFFVLVTTNHFLGWGISVTFDVTFLLT